MNPSNATPNIIPLLLSLTATSLLLSLPLHSCSFPFKNPNNLLLLLTSSSTTTTHSNMARKKMTHQSKQQQKDVSQPPQEPQSQPPLPIDNATSANNKLQTLKTLNSLLLKETSQRRLQVESLESLLSETADDNVVSELENSVTYAFVKSQVAEMGFRFVTERNDTVSELEEKVLEAENRERKVLEELRKAKSEVFEKERLIG
ncbi:MAG: hypothetical protein Q8877_02915 [Sweet potato little leaf phytoplasma]|nr:hypothetical protein [Sweet potato little leaf phytoplasma]